MEIMITLAYLLDLLIGDPVYSFHPVRIMGIKITFLEKRLRKGKDLRIKGIILAFTIVCGSALICWLILYSLRKINPILEIIAWVFLAYTCLSIKDLAIHARRVLERLKNKDINGASKKLSLIVGRDTEGLSEEKIIRATIESIAENTNDGIIAPLFYLFLGGPILAIIYKAINTLDSMVGYKNEKYIYFGWFSAKLDDIANFIPIRITGILIVASSFILRKNFKDSFRVMIRDYKKHLSLNAGISETSMALALGIRLGGPSTYQGELRDKPYIGEDKRQIEDSLIEKSLRISFLSSFIMVLLGLWII